MMSVNNVIASKAWQQAYRYELKPNNKQRTLLLKHSGVARFAYNWGLSQRIILFEQNKGRNKFTTAITNGVESVYELWIAEAGSEHRLSHWDKWVSFVERNL
jgi:putative transposase